MKAVIFAGGAGTRLWPMSRKKSPKQFEKIVGEKSTLQLAIDRLSPEIKPTDIYISTNIAYKSTLTEQLPEIPAENFLFEPEKKDVGPAVSLVMAQFYKTHPTEPVAILWSDHLVKEVGLFKKILLSASEYISQHTNKIVFIGHKPRYASTNLGYIHIGQKDHEKDAVQFYRFEGFKYKPDPETAERFFSSGEYAWNLGYFVTTAAFLHDAFKRFSPDLYENTEKIMAHFGKPDYEEFLKSQYGKVESVSFDNAILDNLKKEDARVIMEDIGWSDIGAWDALTEALQSAPGENITRGNLVLEKVSNSLIYNYEDTKLVVGIDIDDAIIVNTKDVVLIAKKSSVGKIKTLVENFQGTEHEKLT